MSFKKVLIKKGRQSEIQQYLEIEVAPDSSDFVMFQDAMYKRTDSHHENFNLSSFGYFRLFDMSVQARFKFHTSEIHILLRRLREYPEDKYFYIFPAWISFIQEYLPE